MIVAPARTARRELAIPESWRNTHEHVSISHLYRQSPPWPSNRAPKTTELSGVGSDAASRGLLQRDHAVPFQRWNFKTAYPHCWSDFRSVPVLEMLQELSGNRRIRWFDAPKSSARTQPARALSCCFA